jgi:DNA polymerase I-like protein with 3'-5' exonuclease and polymerase domains
MQEILDFMKPKSEWRAPEFSELPDDWNRYERVGIDTETKDPDLKTLGPGVKRLDSYIVGISVSFEGGGDFYLPIRHAGGGNIEQEKVLDYLRTQAANFTGTLVGMNLSYDLGHLLKERVVFKKVKWVRDISIADVLIYELHDRYSLDAIAKRWKFESKDEAILNEAAKAYNVSPKAGMWQLHAKYVGAYAEKDALLPLKILRKQERKIESEGIQNIFDLESELLPILVNVRDFGVGIDQRKLTEIEQWSLAEEEKQCAFIRHHTKHRLQVGEVWKAAALVPILNDLGIKMEKTSTGQDSVSKELFGREDHPVVNAIAKARKVNKLRTTFATSIRNHMVNGRIHCNFNQMAYEDKSGGDVAGARYGRLSSSNPNMQQQPSRDEFAKQWRSIYIPEPGHKWLSADYSQQEPRMLIHFAELLKATGAGEAAEKYRTDPTTDNHQMMADIADIPRKQAKDIFLGLCYGMGEAKLCRSLGLETKMKVSPGGYEYEGAGEEGDALLKKFHQKVPFVSETAKTAQEVAKKRGSVQTILGRKLHFPTKKGGGYDWTHKALNRIIQGSSADQTKKAMVQLAKEGFQVHLQVHDEITFSIKGDEKQRINEIMTTCVKMQVPSKVDLEVGDSWGGSMG